MRCGGPSLALGARIVGCKLQESPYQLRHDGSIGFSAKRKPSGYLKLVSMTHLLGTTEGESQEAILIFNKFAQHFQLCRKPCTPIAPIAILSIYRALGLACSTLLGLGILDNCRYRVIASSLARSSAQTQWVGPGGGLCLHAAGQLSLLT